MMDTVYGTKKYFQSLSGNASDIYRSSACRVMPNDYSYQNTFGRRSVIGPYQHMNSHPTYSTELCSQYGYNTWGLWRDQRNLAPSVYSTKSRQSTVKSFSILLSTAAFIVILSIVTIAVLAFYFGTFKGNMEDTVMGFEGQFRVTKGDIFTTGLKYNHTTTYKQKVEYYKRFIERSLIDNGLQIVKVDVMDFGNGPLIEPHFRAILDMRKVPLNIGSVEEHIREAIMQETTALKSLYKSIRIDLDSIDIKRILDEELLKPALYSKDKPNSNLQSNFERKLNKSGDRKGPKLITSTLKPKTTTKQSYEESDIDVENAPVIHGSFEGSFEITKTDADITRKKSTPTRAVSKAGVAVTPFPIRVKSIKTPTIEKVPAPKINSSVGIVNPVLPRINEKSSTTSTSSTSTTTRATTTTTTARPTTTTEKQTTQKSSSTQTTSSSTEPTSISEELDLSSHIVNDPPKLDANLFTSAPILDTEPWRPIRPPNGEIPEKSSYPSINMEAIESGLLPRNKIRFSEQYTDNPEELMFYHSFTNPIFMPSTSGIERLGNSDVRPHPLPVPLIDDVIIPKFKPLKTTSGGLDKIAFNIDSNSNQFEHIGGGVIVKKHDTESNDELENTSIETTTTLPIINTSYLLESESNPLTDESIESTENVLGDLLYDLLNRTNNEFNNNSVKTKIDDSPIESRIDTESLEKPNFLNLKEIILSKNKIQNNSTFNKILTANITEFTQPLPTIKTNSYKNNDSTTTIKPVSTKTTISTMDDSFLFPTHSKWEYINSSNINIGSSSSLMKKVFNKTLQAWIVENNDEKQQNKNNNISFIEFNKNMKNNATNIQGISMIFDTLASKLGITPTNSMKNPPFSPNKFKQSIRIETTTSSTLPPTSPSRLPSTSIITTEKIAASPNKTFLKEEIYDKPENIADMLIRNANLRDKIEEENLSPEIIVGEAEVEVIDPNQYEEMLKYSQIMSSSTESSETLVTLLPVKSNSGIRTYRPFHSLNNNGRKFNPFKETIVKAGIHVTV